VIERIYYFLSVFLDPGDKNDMSTSITALVTTEIKRYTIDSTELAPSEKFDLAKGEKIGVNWIRSAARDDHWEFELKSPKGGFFNWYAFKPHVQVNPPPSPVPGGSASSQVMAMLDVIARTEGTDQSIADGLRTGYDIIFTFDRFTNFSDHPRRLRCSGGLCSDAAGRYQFLSTTWDGLGLPDFQPAQQDRGAIELIRRRGALRLVEAGRITDALQSLSFEWASLPFSGNQGRYGQPSFPIDQVRRFFTQAGGVLA
jgi:muramidase (phage lysozyme)